VTHEPLPACRHAVEGEQAYEIGCAGARRNDARLGGRTDIENCGSAHAPEDR
jgi:hypothetical protein